MKVNRYLTATCLLLIILTCICDASASEIGVSKGAVFTYVHTATWSSDKPNATCTDEFIAKMDITGGKRTIVDFSGDSIICEAIIYYKNGTENKFNEIIDWSALTIHTLPLITPANLKEKDGIANVENALIINSTVTRLYPTGSREINLVNYTYTYTPVYTSGGVIINMVSYTNLFFDKQTGVLVESHEGWEQTGTYKQKQVSTWELIDSSVWTVPEYPTLLPLVIVVVFTLSGALLYKEIKRLNYPLKKRVLI